MAGLLSRFRRKAAVAPPEAEQPYKNFDKVAEQRTSLTSYYGTPGVGWYVGTATGRHVSPHLAENLCGVVACVNAISSAIASLPPIVYRSSGRGRTELPGHPIARLLRSPYGSMTWPDWSEWVLGSVLLRGNALCEILTDGAGRATGLRPIPWHDVNPLLLNSGRLAFDVSTYPDRRRRLLDDEVFYLRDRSDDGLVGRSRISRAPDVIGNASALQDFAAHAWANQASPNGALEIPGVVGEPQMERLRENMRQEASGTANAKRTLILDGGATWKSISVSPADAEILESRKFTTEELARLFQVPPPLIADYSHNTFTNSAQASLWFAQFSLLPWVRKLEAEFSRSVIVGNDVSIEIDMSSLVRGDYATRWQSYGIARSADILSIDEIREQEGYAPRGAVA